MAGKIITIDWDTIKTLPDDVWQYKLLNKQQSAILLALCEYQHWQSRWDNLKLNQDDLDKFMGDIEYRLMGDESMSIDYDALKQAIRDGIYSAGNDFAKQLISGGTGGFSVDEDGNVTVGDAVEEVEIPEDDPATTVIDESLASIMGGAISVARALEKYLDKVDAMYGAVNGTPANPAATTKLVIKSYYPNDGAIMDGVIDLYYTYRTSNSQLAFNTSAGFERYMYCAGYNERAFNQWIIDWSGYVQARGQMMIDLVTGLSEEFFSSYFAAGAAVPSTDYIAASCTKIKDETFTLDMSTNNAPQYTTSGIWKAGHRFLIIIDGTYVDSDTPANIGDGMYFHDTGTGIKSFNTMGFNSGAAVTPPTAQQVPFEASHHYEFTVEKGLLGGDAVCIISRDNGAMNLPNVTGVLTITVKDLGPFAQ